MTHLQPYLCSDCGTGRWHATGCPNGLPDRVFDEADRQPKLRAYTGELLAESRRMRGVRR